MSTKAQQALDPTSCWNKASDTEPVFVLRANDEMAPGLVRLWAENYEQIKLAAQGLLSATQLVKAHDARKIARDMEMWRLARDQAVRQASEKL